MNILALADAFTAIEGAQTRFNAHERRLAECRAEIAASGYDRARDLPCLLPNWKFVIDAAAGRSCPSEIIVELDRHIAAERSKLTHWTRGGVSARLFNLRVARAGEMLAIRAEVA